MTHYEALGLPRTFTAEQLRAKWRSLSSKMHPDRLGNTPEANAAFAEITAAYAVLSTTARRKVYDASIDMLSKPCTVCNGEGQVWKQKGFTNRTSRICNKCKGSGRIG